MAEEQAGAASTAARKCTSTVIDRATGNPTRCAEDAGHEGHHDDGALTWKTPTDPALLALAALQELLDVTDERDRHGEPVIGGDHTGAVNWLLDYADRVRPIIRPKEQ